MTVTTPSEADAAPSGPRIGTASQGGAQPDPDAATFHRLRDWWLLLWHFERHRRCRTAFFLQGHHHHNRVVALREPLASIVRETPGRLGKFRTRQSTVQVLPRVWDEASVLRAVRPHLSNVPRVLLTIGNRALHTYVEGVPLADAPHGTPVPDGTMRKIAALFGALVDVPASELPELPPVWRTDASSSTQFLQNLARFAHNEVYLRNKPRFGPLFRRLGIPDDAVERFTREAKLLRRRPFSLLHSDIHRGNLLTCGDGELALVDWELALYGDPLHDLATHVVRMDYTEEERGRLIELWQQEMIMRGRQELLEGMDQDLSVYVNFEYAQSVFPDTIRAADALPLAASEKDFDVAAASVHRALSRAFEALNQGNVPDHSTVKQALRSWHREQQALPNRLRAVRHGRRGKGPVLH